MPYINVGLIIVMIGFIFIYLLLNSEKAIVRNITILIIIILVAINIIGFIYYSMSWIR